MSQKKSFLRASLLPEYLLFPGGSNAWKISVRPFSLAKFQASFHSQLFFKNSEPECSWKIFLKATKTPLSDILITYDLTKNGNIKPATSGNTGLLHR